MKGGIFGTILRSKSKTFLVFCFCFLLGIVCLSFRSEKFYLPLIISTLCLSSFFVLIFLSSKKARFFGACVFFFCCGLFRINNEFPVNTPEQLSFYQGQEITLQGFISKEPDVREEKVNYTLNIHAKEKNKQWVPVEGKLLVGLPLYPRYSYGQNITITCKLEQPEPIEEFHYEKYLSVQSVWSVCSAPKLELREGESGTFLWKFLYWLKKPVAENISLLWHEPYASFVAGILYGYRGGLGTLNEDFQRTGVTHIVAVSGFNITIIVTLFHSICIFLLIPRKYAFWLMIAGVGLFVLFTGASSSVVRAGIMGILVLIARQLERNSRIHNVLVFTVTLMALHNPFILIWDAGFQLSFLCTCGLVYFSPLLEKYLEKLPNFFSFRESLVSTLSAIIFTLPLILFQFGRLSVVAPVVNLLILPLIPFLMLFGFFSTVASFIWWPLAEAFAFITYWGLFYIVNVVQFFSHLSFASVEFHLPLFGMIFLYFFLIWIMKKWKTKTSL